jgi:hypothetical protein
MFELMYVGCLSRKNHANYMYVCTGLLQASGLFYIQFASNLLAYTNKIRLVIHADMHTDSLSVSEQMRVTVRKRERP